MNVVAGPEPSHDERVERARQYVQELRVFFVHAGVAAAGLLLIFVVNLWTNLAAGVGGDWRAWWSVWAFLGWGSGLLVHGLVVRLNRPKSTTSLWEQRQIDKTLGR